MYVVDLFSFVLSYLGVEWAEFNVFDRDWSFECELHRTVLLLSQTLLGLYHTGKKIRELDETQRKGQLDKI